MRASLNIGTSHAVLRRVAAASLVLLLCCAACTRGKDDPTVGGPGSGSAGSSPLPIALHVVASFYPLEEAAERAGGGRVAVTDLTTPGVEPHDLELTPDDVEAIDTADVVLYLGEGFQPAIEAAVKDAGGTAVDLLAGLPTLPPPDGADAAGLSVDPHVWLDPLRYAALVGEVATAFGTADPAHAAFYRANGDAFTRQLAALDTEFHEGLRHCSRDLILTNHAAFGYLADEYGLRQVAISGLSPDAEPSGDRLASLKTLVQQEGVTTIFTEELVSPEVAETLATEAGVATAVLHTIEGRTPDQAAAGEDYLSLMRENLHTLEVALGCS
jgi:zinc transport system substrate-binding protein